MTKQELINKIQSTAAENGVEINKKDTASIIDSLFAVAAQEISASGKFAYPGFGTFSKRHRKAREGRNPQTGKPIQIAESNTVGFKPAPTLKTRIN